MAPCGGPDLKALSCRDSFQGQLRRLQPAGQDLPEVAARALARPELEDVRPPVLQRDRARPRPQGRPAARLRGLEDAGAPAQGQLM